MVTALSCPNCGNKLRRRARFCDACGLPVRDRRLASVATAPIDYTPQHLVERILADQAAAGVRAPTAGERKLVTAIFADIAGSTALIQQRDPEEVRGLIDPVLALMMEAVHHYEGYVAKSLGDGILALFGAPIAHEDHPQRAVYAALRMQETVQRYADRLDLERPMPLRIRVGIHTGEVLVRAVRTDDLRAEYDPVGQTVHLAARMEGLAAPGSIVVSEATHRLVEDYFEFRALGAVPVKGVAEAVPVHEVLGAGPLRTRLQVAASRGLAPFVGRLAELDRLSDALAQARGGRAQVVGVVGEPGVGKSRLFHEFRRRLPKDCRVLETFSVSHGKAFAYLPLIELLNNYWQLGPLDDERQRRDKVTARVRSLDPGLEQSLPYLFLLLGLGETDVSMLQMDPQIRRRRTFEAISGLLVRESRDRPLVVMFEDLQWLDDESATFLESLVDRLSGTRTLLLVNFRPEYRPGWKDRRRYTELRLDPLGRAEAEALLATLLGRDSSLDSLKPLIMDRTDGNPFFLEEVVQTLKEEQVLSGERGHYRLEQVPAKLQIPTTVQGVLGARIDRLDGLEKELLQTVAVIGKTFCWSLVQKVVAWPEDQLHRRLSRLQHGEFLYARPAFPEVEYSFKHALTQEVAYGTLLRERRAELHERTGRALEVLYPDSLDEHCRELAHHYSCSGNIRKAVRYLQKVAQRAMLQSEAPEAIRHLEQALTLQRQLPEGAERERIELGVLIDLGPARIVAEGYAAQTVETIYSRAQALCRRVGDDRQLFAVLVGLRAFYHVRGELQRAHRLAERLLVLARTEQDDALLMEAHRALGASCFNLGNPAAARPHFEQVLTLYDPSKHHRHVFLYGLDPGVFCHAYLGWVLWHLGYPDQALERARQAQALAQRLGYPFVQNFALVLNAELHLHCRDGPQAQCWAEAAIALAVEHGYTFFDDWATIMQGAALAEQGQLAEGIERMRRGLRDYRATGSGLWRSHFLALLAEAYGKAGQPGEGMEVLAEAHAEMGRSAENLYEVELQRIRGDLILAGAAPRSPGAETLDAAQRCYTGALAIARRQGTRSLALRVALSLGRLYRQRGRIAEARKLLTEIDGSFTEGAGMADLCAARALLAELTR